MTHILNLLYGDDKTSPTREISLMDGTAGIYVQTGGFSPGSGPVRVLFSGASIHHDGQQPLNQARDNTRVSVTYDLTADNVMELKVLQDALVRFFENVRQYRQHYIGEKVWLEYRWNDDSDLDSLPRPVWGQLNYYLEILHAEIVRWPDNLHDGTLVSGNVTGVQIDFIGRSYWEGLEQVALNAEAIPAAAADVSMDGVENAFDFQTTSFTFAGWFKARDLTSASYNIFDVQGSSDYVTLLINDTGGTDIVQVQADFNANGATIDETYTNIGISGGDIVHAAVVYDKANSDLHLYVNGSLRVSDTTFDGTGINEAVTVTLNNYDDDLEAWRVWNTNLSTAQIAALYAAENTARASGSLQQPAYVKTLGGDGVFNNVDGVLNSVAKDNWGVIGHVPGDVPALAKYEFALPTLNEQPHYYFGLKPLYSTYTPDDTHWLDYDTDTLDTNNSSGDRYDTVTITTGNSDIHSTDLNEVASVRGRVRVLARYRQDDSTGDSATVKPYFQLGGSNLIYGDTRTMADSSSFQLIDFGELVIDWPQKTTPPTLTVGIETTAGAGTSTNDIDFIQLLPHPHCLLEAEDATVTIASGDKLVIEGRRAWITDASDSDSQLYHMSYYGDELNPVPGYYNYLFSIQGEDATAYTVDLDITLTLYLTPRYRLPGGMAS